jgi:HPt (histidine-containing phosphotransfer) domain-containing protein
MDKQVIDRNTYDQLKEMAGEDYIGELVDAYLDDSPQLIAAMRDCLKSNDADAFRRSAHSLKSNSASLGAITLSGMARELEMVGKSGDLTGAPPLLEQLTLEYDHVRKQLMDWRHES